MNIAQVISSIDLKAGGPSKSVTELSVALTKNGQSVTILTKETQNKIIEKNENENFKLLLLRKNEFTNQLNNVCKEIDIFHGHGIWLKPIHDMSICARKNKKPYVISPRGMLEPWALNFGKIKKELALLIYQRTDLTKATCIHATSLMELKNLKKLGFNNPVALIPNGLNVSEYPINMNACKKKKRKLLFLSRIHPKKGIEILIEAWAELPSNIKKDWHVDIVGNGDDKYVESLVYLLKKKSIHNEISFIGPKFGEEKIKFYQNASLFILPTYSENFGIVVAEALACGLPVITTTGTPWKELNTENAGWWINPGVSSLFRTLLDALQRPENELVLMGQNGRKLIEQKYSLENVSKMMIQLYSWILNGKDKPDFLFE